MLPWLLALLLALPGAVAADEMVRICYGYGCLVQADIRYTEGQLGEVRRMLASTVNPENERKMISEAVGRLYAWAGEQSAVRNDRGGNYADGHVPGKMDCIDHSTSTTRLLTLLEARGYLRWHRVLPVEGRGFLSIFLNHYSAVIAEKGEGETPRFVVDSWFVDNGQPAVILPLEDWKKGAGPDV
ncbi:MAG: hypothetical protein H6R14_2150 [Proteobacteria bacterium]|nr:hypothetical protein [Pseudomonadota bacterium]